MSNSIATLQDIMAALRDAKSGCPWDLAQDFKSLAPYAIEEAYEVADAIERQQFDELKNELGDLLFQVIFHSQLAKEKNLFDFNGVVDALNEKMRRRHPHVFPVNDSDVVYPENVEQQTLSWELIKKQERNSKTSSDTSTLADISSAMPEWMRATKLQKRAATVGFDWPNIEFVFDKLQEELLEVREQLQFGKGHDALQDEIGDVLFVCVNLARHSNVDFGAALRGANAKFERRFRAMENMAQQQEMQLSDFDINEQEKLWRLVKLNENTKDTIND